MPLMGSGDATGAARAVSGRPRTTGLVGVLGRQYPLGVLALAAAYLGAAHVGYAFDFAGPVAAVVWLPVGVGIAFLYLAGPRFWPGVVVGDLLANDYSALPFGSALGQTCGNVLEVLVATLLLRRLVPDGRPLNSVSGVGRMLVAIATGAAVSSTVGSLSLRLGDVISSGDVPDVWRTWWLGDSAGALLVLPLALAWYRPRPRGVSRARALEAVLLLAAVVALSELALHTTRPLTYLVFPALIWAALRFGQRGATLAVVTVAAFTVWATTHYVGPFSFDSISRSILSTQLFLAAAALSTLCLAAVVCERERFAERLGASRARLLDATNAERRRIEHNIHDGAQQRLTALVIRLGMAADRSRGDASGAAAAFEEAVTQLQEAIEELRQLSQGIHPLLLTELGLADAINDLAARSVVPVGVLEVPRARVDETAEATAYYVLAEAVANAQKHANASVIHVRAAVRPGMLCIEVLDDGIGGAAEATGSGLGGLRDRVERAGGTFEIGDASRGTRVAAAIPATRL
jgi:signal transduction histidine kinase